jgi:DNA-binding MarR family transcriptional regulator
MTVNSDPERLALRVWFLSHRTHELLRRCEDQVFSEYNLTTEQYTVLVTIKYLDDPVRPTDVARWMGRSPNSVSMIVDRMVKAGLVRRIRDRSDRREVRLVITSKGENAIKPATLAGWEFIRKILSPLSYEDRGTLVSLNEVIKDNAFKYLNPGVDIEEMKKNEITNQADLIERLRQYISTSTPKAKRRGGEKRKTV